MIAQIGPLVLLAILIVLHGFAVSQTGVCASALPPSNNTNKLDTKTRMDPSSRSPKALSFILSIWSVLERPVVPAH
jgi:hypothetical protein